MPVPLTLLSVSMLDCILSLDLSSCFVPFGCCQPDTHLDSGPVHVCTFKTLYQMLVPIPFRFRTCSCLYCAGSGPIPGLAFVLLYLILDALLVSMLIPMLVPDLCPWMPVSDRCQHAHGVMMFSALHAHLNACIYRFYACGNVMSHRNSRRIWIPLVPNERFRLYFVWINMFSQMFNVKLQAEIDQDSN